MGLIPPSPIDARPAKAELVRLSGALMTAGVEFALAAMPVEQKVGRRIGSQERGDSFDPLLHLAYQRRKLHLPHGIAIAVYDSTKGYLASNRFGKNERIEREGQRVVLVSWFSPAK